MRILQIIDSFSPAAGGPPAAVRQLILATRKAGTDVEALCLDDPGAEFLQGIGCPVHALGQSYLGRYAYSPRLWRWLHEHAGRFDGIVMNGIWSFPGVALYFAARRPATPYGIFVHGALDPWFNRQYRMKYLKKLLYWPVQYAVLRRARAVFFTAAAERDLAITSFKPSRWNSVVVPYGILEPEECREGSNAQAEEFYRRLPRLRGRRFLLFLARIHEKKGCDLLIEAFARIARSAPDLDLVIAGPDQERMQSKLQQRAERLGLAGRVHWPGMIGGGVKWGALRACDALILPSHQENLGISVVEALAVGRPVLVSRQVNIWREIEDAGAGLADEDTIEGTERLLRRWLDLPAEERAAMAAGAEPCFSERFSMQRTVAAINNVFVAAK
jgi:glycosyltransferase involved in cell wall biosynthesis